MKGQVCPLWPVTQASQSQEPSEAAAALSQASGKGVSCLLPLGSKCKGGLNSIRAGNLPPLSLMAQQCSLQFHLLTFRLISFLIGYLCGPFKQEKNKHLLCARHCVRHF